MSLAHPPKDQLIAFGQGALAADELSQIELHLEVCRECCETLLDLKDDTFVGLLRIAKSHAAVADAASSRTDPGADANPAGHDSARAATLLVQSSEPVSVDELPAELREHPRYRIVELIGRGGMGNVYRAEHRLMNREVALKLINSQLIRHPQAVERFRREVQAAAKLTHPNIVTAYDAEQAGDVHFLVMEFVEGTDLASVVKHRGPMSVVEACECIRQAAVGLQHAHEKGMVHRDIKPHNLMLSAEGQVRILDFGLAGFASESVADAASVRIAEDADAGSVGHVHLTTAGSVMGTPDYIAPEQAKDAHSADIRADIYSLGCTLHFLLTGKPPFEADNVIAKLKAHAQEPPPSLTTLRDDVPAELSKVVTRMLAKSPAERFQAPAEVAAALAPFAQAALPPRSRIRRAIAAGFLFAALILAAFVIYVQTDTGTFEIRASEEVAVHLEQSRVKIHDTVTGRKYELKAGKHSIRKGEYLINVTELPDGLTVDTETFRLTRGGEKRVTVTFKPKFENATVSDESRLQGKWIAVSGQARKKPLTAAELAQLSITFDGERVEFVSHTGPPTPLAATFTINPNRDPKQIDFVAPGKQEAMPGIYQFEGERLKLALIDQDYSRPTNFEPDHRPDHLTAVFERVPVAAALGQEESKVLKAAEAYLAVADEGDFDKLYDLGSNLAKKQAKREQVVPLYQQIRDTAGKVEKRTLRRVRLIDEFLGLPPGRYAAVQYASDFEKHEGLWETVMLNVDDDGQWRANTYAATVQPLPLPEPKKAPTKGASSTGTNLITDPSFENTGLTQLPRDWRAWTNENSDFRCEVVNGGHTGQRSLRITGKGIRGVVFGNDLKADRSKRYALKGWAKFEGDKDARAVIKFNYFRGSEFLGVHDLVGATADQPGWQLFEKTDALDAYPQADHFYAMCHVEGSGTGWFDDLELVAYDRDKLPNDFDARHGRHNRLHGPNSLIRWVGTWDTEYVFRETDNSPKETKLKMTTISERTLGDYFLMSHAVADAASISKPTLAASATSAVALGAEERLLFRTFDQNVGAFRQWIFSSNGKVFEWRGPWNQETQSLELRMLPDASNLHSTEHFVDAEHIEAKLHFQYVMGQRDAGRWTATLKAANGKVDVPAAKTHVAEPAELSQLNKFAGEWTIRATYKPSVWNPQQREETIRETSVWILGGRFLMTRAFNEKDELTSIWIATYEPSEKSNRFWFFNADGSSGEWRLTWDEASRGFHFRAVDLPTGWIGTGFNRWVDENTFGNSAVITDENGRVLLKMMQDKRRKK